ncbi:homocysteine S-methyltransferase family protein [Nocardioides donggukensis]|uniref:Homocysteine S-methyltransferase family protein n=1 Tax=Nocardioides donggukensis TaxID=2774019 RepID=A0A927K900_9ACTN|nr:homocysteine S-methyltransferase family protein [Nocardioides donggukensis]MBD8869966.1 homocysteine S-methyltransferase family protein [Nocardioides donggukensis]
MNHSLPQLGGQVFLSEAGLETDLIFHHGYELPHFAAFPLLESPDGRRLLTDYYQAVIEIARNAGTGAVLETPTWRASPDWGGLLDHPADRLDAANRDAVGFLQGLRAANPDVTVVVSGNLGPRGDGYVTGELMSPEEAAAYHRTQIDSFATAGADLVTVLTMTYREEAIGIVMAAREAGLPVVVSFTVETDGSLPSGQSLAEAITEVDEATDGYAAYFMLNCAHPDHFEAVLAGPGPWHRLCGLRANASRMSHAELDDATELDRGDEAELAAAYARIRDVLPQLAVAGGCCGTDLAHLRAISHALH